MQDLIALFRALGEENRLRILEMLREGRLCVSDITGRLGITQSSVSHHLRVLREAGLVECHRRGLWIDYSLATDGSNPYAEPLLEKLAEWSKGKTGGRRRRN